MQLPLLLAGPVLRRVDAGLVAVQVMLSEPADGPAHRVGGPGRVRHHEPAVRAAAATRRTRTRRRRTPARRRCASASSSTSASSPRACHPRPARSSSPTGSTPTTSPSRAPRTRRTSPSSDCSARTRSAASRCGPLGYADRMLPSFALPADDARRPAARVRLVPPARVRRRRRAGVDGRVPGRAGRRPARADPPAVPRRRPDLRRRRRLDHDAARRASSAWSSSAPTDGRAGRAGRRSTRSCRRPPAARRPRPTRPRRTRAETPQETAAAGDLPAGPPQFPVAIDRPEASPSTGGWA